MKALALASALALTATSAFAGQMAAPMADDVVEAPIVAAEPVSSGFGAGWVVPAVALALVGVAIAASSDDDDDDSSN